MEPITLHEQYEGLHSKLNEMDDRGNDPDISTAVERLIESRLWADRFINKKDIE